MWRSVTYLPWVDTAVRRMLWSDGRDRERDPQFVDVSSRARALTRSVRSTQPWLRTRSESDCCWSAAADAPGLRSPSVAAATLLLFAEEARDERVT
jgi:hypothetical protein